MKKQIVEMQNQQVGYYEGHGRASQKRKKGKKYMSKTEEKQAKEMAAHYNSIIEKLALEKSSCEV